MTGRRVIFLDRDGVINKLLNRDGGWYSPRRIEDFHLREDIGHFCSEMRSLGFDLIVVTNQPDISRQLVSWSTLNRMHAVIRDQLSPIEIVVCPHTKDDNCSCRKPKSGMIDFACIKHDIDRNSSVLIGDQESDLGAGKAARVRSFLFDAGEVSHSAITTLDEFRPRSFDEITSAIQTKLDGVPR